MYHVLLYLISVYQAATVRSSSSPSAVIKPQNLIVTHNLHLTVIDMSAVKQY